MHSIFFAENINKKYKGFKLENISFQVEPGSIVGIIGRNGVGKTTLLNCLMGAVEPDLAVGKGPEVRIDDTNLFSEVREYKKQIAYVFSETPFRMDLSPVNLGRLYGRYYDNFDQAKYLSLLNEYGLSKADLGKKINLLQLSQGQKIRQELAFALSYEPSVYFLDEPAGNLDVAFRDEFYDTIRNLVAKEDKCVIFASHLVEEMENFADYILWLKEEDGVSREFFFGSLDQLRDSYRIVSGEEELLEKLPKELIAGGRISESSKEILVEWDEDRLRKFEQYARFAELKEIMYYVEKGQVIKRD